MKARAELLVGRKGEIYTTEAIRLAVGIVARSKLVAEARDGELILRPKENADSLLKKRTFQISPIRPKQLSELRNKLASELGERS